MRDLEKASSREEDGERPIIKGAAVVRTKSSHKCVVLCMFITVVALGTLLVPASQGRITNLAGSAGVYDIKKAFQTASTPQSTIVNMDDDADATVDDDDHATSERMHVDYHTNRFDYTSSWCPHANCQGTPICYPCQRRWLIIVTTGRSASTTLTEMIMRLPGVRMTGENNNLIGRFENLLKDWPKDMILGTAPAWFHHPIPQESWSCASQTIFTTANPPLLVSHQNNNNGDTGEAGEMLMMEESDEKTILGFKTIRLFDDAIKQHSYNLTQWQIQHIASEMLESLYHLFPCSRFVVNYRSDVASQVASWTAQFGVTNPATATKMLQLDNDMLHAFHTSAGPQRSFLLDSTEWTKNITSFNAMVDWLGFENCHFSAALEYNTQDGYAATKTDEELSRDCQYLYN